MIRKIISSFLLASLFVSCSDNTETNAALKKLSDEQALVIAKLNALDKKVDKISKSSPSKKDDKPKADPNKVYDIAEAGSVVLGNPNAPVTITKWTDFQWPYCAKSVGLVDDILKKYPNDVKVLIKNFPLSFHKQAMKAAQYALAADRQGKYKEMYHAIMEDFRKLKTNEDMPLDIAATMGLDVEKLKADANDPAIKAQIDKEINQLKNSGIPRLAVPKFLVAGKEPQGRDLASFSRIIDAELKKKGK